MSDQYIDIEQGLSRVRGNKSLYKRMLSMFIESKEISEFEKQINNGESEEASKTAHAIKGISGNLALSVLFDLSSDLVEELRNGVIDEKNIADYHDALEKTLIAVNEAITQLDL